MTNSLSTVPKVSKLFTILACCLLTACVHVFQTSSLDIATQNKHKKFCRTPTGIYALPKGELSFKIVKISLGNAGRFRYKLEPIADGYINFVADQKHRYCLDFIANPYYADSIGIVRTPDQRLERVFSNVEDKSKGIIESISEGLGIAAASSRARRSGGRSFGNEDEFNPDILQFRFDPFDPKLLEATNKALAFTGHCIYLDPENDPFVPFWMGNQCNEIKIYKYNPTKFPDEDIYNNSSFEAADGRFGILYKPLLPHTLVIMKKDDPTSSKPWRVWKRLVVELPNRSPPFMLEVKRSAFVQRKTDITFNQGLLDNVEVDKPSELLGVADIIVRIVQVVVQIPAKALIIGINDAKNRAALIETNQKLLDLLSEIKASREGQLEKFNALTPEQQTAAMAAGLDPRSAAARSLSLQACINNAALENIEDAERVCLQQRASQ